MNFTRTTQTGNIVLAFLILLVCALTFLFVAYGAVEAELQATGHSLTDIINIFPR